MDLFKMLFVKKYTPTDAERILISTINVDDIARILDSVDKDMAALKALKRYFNSTFSAETKDVIDVDRLAMLCYKKYYKDKFEMLELDFMEQ